jgi:hypothetical protein
VADGRGSGRVAGIGQEGRFAGPRPVTLDDHALLETLHGFSRSNAFDLRVIDPDMGVAGIEEIIVPALLVA